MPDPMLPFTFSPFSTWNILVLLCFVLFINKHILHKGTLHLKEDIRPDTAADIVLGDTVVHIGAVGMVDDLPRGGVLLGKGDVIVHHHNDVVIRHTVGVHDLVGVTHIRLVAVVEPSIAASNQHHPQVSILREEGT